jgi:hypothetical protein
MLGRTAEEIAEKAVSASGSAGYSVSLSGGGPVLEGGGMKASDGVFSDPFRRTMVTMIPVSAQTTKMAPMMMRARGQPKNREAPAPAVQRGDALRKRMKCVLFMSHSFSVGCGCSHNANLDFLFTVYAVWAEIIEENCWKGRTKGKRTFRTAKGPTTGCLSFRLFF